MKHTTRMAVCCLFAVAFAACRPEVDVTPIDPSDGQTGGATYVTASNSYADIFKAFWQGMDTNYVFWDVEPTGYWDEVWNTYKPLFDALGTYDVTDISDPAKAKVTAAREYIKAMVYPLKDGHLSIRVEYYDPLDSKDNPEKRPPSYSPAGAKVDARYASDANKSPKATFYLDEWGDLNNNFWVNAISKYMDAGSTKATKIDDASHNGEDAIRMATGTIAVSGGHIRYLYFSGFAITANIGEPSEAAAPYDAAVNDILNAYFDDLDDPACKGVVFDLRGNTGGANRDIPLLLSPLLTSDLTFAHTRLKKGAGRLNYMPWAPYVLKANSAGGTFSIDGGLTSHKSRAANAGTIPVVALVNDYSISCGEIMPMAVKALPTGHLIGTRTWGGTGPHWQVDSPANTHGGCFTHNKLWTRAYQTGWQMRGLHLESYEGAENGVPPDQEVEFSLSNFNGGTKGSDDQLNAAIRHIAPAWNP